METKLTFPFSRNSSFEKSILLRNEKGMCEYLHKDLLEMIIKYTTYVQIYRKGSLQDQKAIFK